MDYEYEVYAEFHRQLQTKYGLAYRVKACVPELGIFINGMMVYAPNQKHPEWKVNPPGMPNQPGKFVVEFNTKLPLWIEIEAKCLELAKIEHSSTKDEVITEIPDGPITLDDIPF